MKSLETKYNILIPMSGLGSRFKGYNLPKPLIDVNGIPMIAQSMKTFHVDANFIFIVRREHVIQHNIDQILLSLNQNYKIIVSEEDIPQGAAHTSLLANDCINNDIPLIISNCDQFLEWDFQDFVSSMTEDIDGSLATFEANDPKFSFVRLNDHNNVIEVAEKKVISNLASAGVYYWKYGSDFIKYANQMISKGIRVNNEFYVAPVYNEAIQDGKIIKSYNCKKLWNLGNPIDLGIFLEAHK